MKKYRVAIVGATGFTGSELVRLLYAHPQIEIAAISSESRTGEAFDEVHPFFSGLVQQKLCAADNLPGDIDLAFLALPHGVSMDYVAKWHQANFKIIDLSGDFRLSSPAVYEEWYGQSHRFAAAFSEAIYGLPEIHAEAIAKARLVANPGCFPTSAILALAPLMEKGLIDPETIIIDAKTGVSGAGVKAKAVNHFDQVNDNFKAYGIKSHRHSIEIEEQLSALAQAKAPVQFTPHLLPLDRGILATAYAKAPGIADEAQLAQLYRDFYQGAAFVRLRKTAPALKEVRGTNYVDLFPSYDPRTGNVIVVSAIDNLVKGAAGQAIHNMNLMLGLPEKAGLDLIPLHP